MKTWVHRSASLLAMAIIALFFASSIIVEVIGDELAVASVKQMIVYGLFVLVPAMAITAISGRVVAGARQGKLIKTKMNRMRFIVINGIVMLIPCAILLNNWAASGRFDTLFYTVQGIELLAGALNLSLMGLNVRDGLLLAGRLRPKRSLMTNN